MSLLQSDRSRERWVDHELVESLCWSFRQACIGAGIALAVDSPIAGTSYRTPTVTNVVLAAPMVFTVKMLEGQVPAALGKVGHLIAPHLGGVALRVADRGHGWAVVTLLTSDPLAGVLELGPARDTRVVIGRDEGGLELAVADPVDLPHIIAQGQTRSGKSTWLYSLLVQLVRQPRVIVAGVDPSGITLRPFVGTAHEKWQVSGLADLGVLEDVLTVLVADMDYRLAAMPRDRDILPITDDHPLIVTVLDEYPALLRALDADDPKRGKRCRSLVARLLAESHKVGHRVVIAAQRAEASIVGAAERAQCGGRLSFRVDSADSVKLLHPDAELYAADHTSAEPGIATGELARPIFDEDARPVPGRLRRVRRGDHHGEPPRCRGLTGAASCPRKAESPRCGKHLRLCTSGDPIRHRGEESRCGSPDDIRRYDIRATPTRGFVGRTG